MDELDELGGCDFGDGCRCVCGSPFYERPSLATSKKKAVILLALRQKNTARSKLRYDRHLLQNVNKLILFKQLLGDAKLHFFTPD